MTEESTIEHEHISLVFMGKERQERNKEREAEREKKRERRRETVWEGVGGHAEPCHI